MRAYEITRARAQAILAGALFIASALLPVSHSTAAEYGRLRGDVSDVATGEAIPGALVIVLGPAKWAGWANGHGYYSVLLPPGMYMVEAFKAQYVAVTRRVTLLENATTTADFALAPMLVGPVFALPAQPSRSAAAGPSSAGPSSAAGGSTPAGGLVSQAFPGPCGDLSCPPTGPLAPRIINFPSPVGVVTDPSLVLTVSDIAKPPYLSPIVPAPFGTTVTRIAGDPGTPIGFAGGGTGVWNSVARHHYSNDEPWNADQTLIAMDQPGGSPSLLFLDGSTYRPQFPACAAFNRGDDRWHPGLPHVRINVPSGGTVLEWFDVVQCAQMKAWTLPFPVTYIGLTNGNVSADARLIALGTASRMFIVNMQTNKIGPAVDITYGGLLTPSGFGVSPSGKYAWVHDGNHNDTARIFDIDPTTLALTPHPTAGPICFGTNADGFVYNLGHFDVALNPFDNGEDVMIGQEHCGYVGQVVAGQLLGHVVMVRLRDGAITSLTNPTNEAAAYHVSARATNRPGWVYVSYYERQDSLRFNQELISVRMDGSQTVERWAHLHTDTTGCYACEAHPVPSRDGLRIIFASTWSLNCDSGCGTPPTVQPTVVQDYVVDGRAVH